MGAKNSKLVKAKSIVTFDDKGKIKDNISTQGKTAPVAGVGGVVTSKDVKVEYEVNHDPYNKYMDAVFTKVFNELFNAIVEENQSQDQLENLYSKFYGTRVKEETALDYYEHLIARAKEFNLSQDKIDKIYHDSLNNESFIAWFLLQDEISPELLTYLVDLPPNKIRIIFGNLNDNLYRLANHSSITINDMKKLIDKYADVRENNEDVASGVLWNPEVNKEVLAHMLKVDYPGNALADAYEGMLKHQLMDAQLMEQYVEMLLDGSTKNFSKVGLAREALGNQFLTEDQATQIMRHFLNRDTYQTTLGNFVSRIDWVLDERNGKHPPEYFTKEKMKRMIELNS